MSISLFLSMLMLFGLVVSIPFGGYLMWSEFIIYVDWQFCYLGSSSMNLSLVFDKFGVFFSCVIMFISLNVFFFLSFMWQGSGLWRGFHGWFCYLCYR